VTETETIFLGPCPYSEGLHGCIRSGREGAEKLCMESVHGIEWVYIIKGVDPCTAKRSTHETADSTVRGRGQCSELCELATKCFTEDENLLV